MDTNNSQPSSTPSDADAARARFLESMGIPSASDLEQKVPPSSSADAMQVNPPAMEAAPDIEEDAGVVLSSSPDDVELPGANPNSASPARTTSVGPAATTFPSPTTEDATASRVEMNASAEHAAPALEAETSMTESTIETTPPPLQPNDPLSEIQSPVSEETPPPLESTDQTPATEGPDAFDATDNSPASAPIAEASDWEETAPAEAELPAPAVSAEPAMEVPVEPTTEETSEVDEEEAEKSAEGPLQLHCPKCEGELILRREHLGVEGACVWCGIQIVAAESGMDRQVRVFPVFQPDVVTQKSPEETTPAVESSVDSTLEQAIDESAVEVAAVEDVKEEPSKEESSKEAAPAPAEPLAAEESVQKNDFSGQDDAWSSLATLPTAEAAAEPQAENYSAEESSSASDIESGFSGLETSSANFPAFQEEEPEVIAADPVNEQAVESEVGRENFDLSAFSEAAAEIPSAGAPDAVNSGFDFPVAPSSSEESPTSLDNGFDMAMATELPAENLSEEEPAGLETGFEALAPNPTPEDANEATPEMMLSAMENGFGSSTPESNPEADVPSTGFESMLPATETATPENVPASTEAAKENPDFDSFASAYAAPGPAPENPAPADAPSWETPAEPANASATDEAPAPIGFGELIENSDASAGFEMENSPATEDDGPSSFFSASPLPAPAPEEAPQELPAALEEPAEDAEVSDAGTSNDVSSDFPEPGSPEGGFAIPSGTSADAFAAMGGPRTGEEQVADKANSSEFFAEALNTPSPDPAAEPEAEPSQETAPVSWGESKPLPAPDPVDAEANSQNGEEEPESSDTAATPVREEPTQKEGLPAPNVEKSTLFSPAQSDNSGNGLFAASTPPPVPQAETEANESGGASNVEKSPIGAISAPAPDNGKGSKKRPRKGLIIFLVILIGFVSGAAAVSFFLPVEQYVLKAQAFVEALVNPTEQQAAPSLPTSGPVPQELSPEPNPATVPELDPAQPAPAQPAPAQPAPAQPAVTPAPPAVSPAPAN